MDPPGGDPLDIKFARSDDGGGSWSAPVRVNDDTGNAWQWFGTMSASPSGRIDAIWLDTRDDPGSYLSSLYYSYSEDGGATWSANERLSEAFDPHLGWPNQNKMGDYFHMVSDNTGFRLAWAATFNGEQDVYFARKTIGLTATGEPSSHSVGLLTADANPFTGSTTIRYAVPVNAHVTLKVYDALGRQVTTLATGEHSAGNFTARLDGRGLPGGVYFARLRVGELDDSMKLMHLK
ncbi:MAG: T9SS type A sorting domain-containing protein [bacterium]|nr:T9SS type A sorting domain-containing protein [bacterium]